MHVVILASFIFLIGKESLFLAAASVLDEVNALCDIKVNNAPSIWAGISICDQEFPCEFSPAGVVCSSWHVFSL